MDVSRLLFAGALTVLFVGSLSSFGALGNAATSTKHSIVAVKRALTRSRPQVALDTPAGDQYAPAKVTICHNGHTIVINRSALPAHLRKGDTTGACQAVAAGVAARNRDDSLSANTTLPDALATTGLSLAGTVLTSLLLITIGLALRRRSKPQQPHR